MACNIEINLQCKAQMKTFTKDCVITFDFPSRLDAGFLGHVDLLSAPGAFRMKILNKTYYRYATFSAFHRSHIHTGADLEADL